MVIDSVKNLGVVVVDVQKKFLTSAVTKNMKTVMQNTVRVLRLAEIYQVPFFITYEEAKTDDNDIPEELKSILPEHQQAFVKTTFAATGEQLFIDAINRAQVTHFLVLGAETDVCVLQTVLGLRKLGFQVSVQSDAVFSSECNISPALRHMTMAGANLIKMQDVEKLFQTDQEIKQDLTKTNLNVEPILHGKMQVSLILNQLNRSHPAYIADYYRKEKLQRLVQLLLLSDWLGIPVYSTGETTQSRNILEDVLDQRARHALEGFKWRRFSEFPGSDFKQVVIAGTDQDLGSIIESLGSRQVFTIEDALFSLSDYTNQVTSTHKTIPLTYKAFHYAMRKSILRTEWPSRDWSERELTFAQLMTPPEQLAPIGLMQ